MNSRRKINNITKKDGFDNMYELHYSINGDIRRNKNCAFHTVSFMYIDSIVTFENDNVLKKTARQLSLSKKALVEILKSHFLEC
jgi:hypothetical protein